MFKAVDVECYRRSGEPENGRERGISRITNQGGVKPRRDGMDRGKEAVNNRIKVLVPNGGKNFQPNTVILQLPR